MAPRGLETWDATHRLCCAAVAAVRHSWRAPAATHLAHHWLTQPPPPVHASVLQFLLISDSDIPLYDPLTFYQQVRCTRCGSLWAVVAVHCWHGQCLQHQPKNGQHARVDSCQKHGSRHMAARHLR